jgi:hypothetical protein
MLTQTACQPLYGRISDLVGRKVNLKHPVFSIIVDALPEPSVLKHGYLRHWIPTLRSCKGKLSSIHFQRTHLW